MQSKANFGEEFASELFDYTLLRNLTNMKKNSKYQGFEKRNNREK